MVVDSLLPFEDSAGLAPPSGGVLSVRTTQPKCVSAIHRSDDNTMAAAHARRGQGVPWPTGT